MNINYNYNSKIEHLLKSQIFITGFTRSGTSIMSFLVGSLQNAYLSFEPMMINLLLNSDYKIQKKDFIALYKSYFFEDFFISQKNGRNFNFNQGDDSNINFYKNKSFINESLNSSKRRFEIINNLEYFEKIAIKCANIYFDNEKLNDYSIENLIVMIRNPEDILKSVIKKGWLNKKYSERGYTKTFKKFDNQYVPFHLKKEEISLWKKKNSYEKFCWEIQKFNLNCLKLKNKKVLIIDYDDFCKSPNQYAKYISSMYKLKISNKTKNILKLIHPSKKSFFNYHDYKNKLNKNLYLETIDAYKKIFNKRLVL